MKFLEYIDNRQVKILNLSNNGLENIYFLSKFECLECLNINNNNLNDISTIEHCITIKEFDFSNNKINKFPNCSKMSELIVINASNNFIDSFQNIGNLNLLNHFEKLILDNNPIAKNPNFHPILSDILPNVRLSSNRSNGITNSRDYGTVN